MYLKTEKPGEFQDLKAGESRFWSQVGLIKKEDHLDYEVKKFRCYPDVAEYLLTLNTFEKQRNLSKKNVRKFMYALHSDTFAPGESIRMCWDEGHWVLTNGQHRLFAIAESGIAADLTVVFVFRDIHLEYATVDSIGGLRSSREVALAYGFDYTEEITGRNLDRFLAACGIIYGNFARDSREPRDKLQVSRFAEELKLSSAMTLLREWGAGSGVFGASAGSIKASILSVALVTVKHAPTVIAEDFWVNAFQNDGLKRRDCRRLLNEIITILPKRGSGGGTTQYNIVKETAHLWNTYVSGKTELDKVYIPETMPSISLTPYPLKNQDTKAL